jgi:O-antigen/teichoic acid export membrane protein
MSDSEVKADNPVPQGERSLDSRIVQSSAWVALSYGGTRVLSTVGLVVLAHLLTPADIGVVSLASVFLLFTQGVQGGGLYAALVHRRQRVDEAIATAFLFAGAAALALYGVIFLAAPLVADLFRAPRLDEVVRGLGLVVIANGFGMTPKSVLARDLQFNRLAKAELAAGALFVVVSVSLALLGFGVWSLVAGRVASAAGQTAINWQQAPVLPSLRLASRRVLGELFTYGRYISGTNFVVLITTQLDTIFVGRLLGTASVGFYSAAYRLASFPTGVIGAVAGRVMFPAYAMMQDNLPALRRAYVSNLQRVALVGFLLSVPLVVAAEPIVIGVLGARWAPAIGPLRLLAVFGLLRAFSAASGPVFRGVGRPQLDFWFTLPNAIALPIFLILLVPSYGTNGAALAMVLAAAVTALPKFVMGVRVLGLPTTEALSALRGPVLCGGILAAALLVLVPATDHLNDLVALALLLVGGGIIYLAAASLFARDIVRVVWRGVRPRVATPLSGDAS